VRGRRGGRDHIETSGRSHYCMLAFRLLHTIKVIFFLFIAVGQTSQLYQQREWYPK
jgi:hypothetical protein